MDDEKDKNDLNQEKSEIKKNADTSNDGTKEVPKEKTTEEKLKESEEKLLRSLAETRKSKTTI